MLTVLLTSLLLPPAPAPAFEPEAVTPKGPPPRLVSGKVVKDRFVSVQTIFQAVPVTRVVKVNVGGAVQEQTVVAYQTVTRTSEQSFDLSGITATDAEGKKIPLAALRKRLDKERLVVVSA